MSSRRKLLFTAIMLLVLALLLELFSYGILSFEASRRPHKFRHDAAYYLDPMPENWAEKFYAHGFDPVLGWDGVRYEKGDGGRKARQGDKNLGYDAEGARLNPDFANEPAVIAAYGDSFTKGAEVAWNETWEYYLSQKLGRYVANYGVGGYGPDQATIKFQRRPRAAPRPAIAILGIFEENINRAVNRYRAYYQEDPSSFLAFKPRFLPEPAGGRLLPSPLKEATTDRRDLTQAVIEAREDDVFWMRKIDFTFPYTLALGKLALLAFDKATGGFLPLGLLSDNLWEAPQARATMDSVIDGFVAEAKARDIRPVILFLPRIRRATAEDPAAWTPNYTAYFESLRSRYRDQDLPILDVANAEFEAAKMHVRPFEGHYSPYGNDIVAQFVYEQLALENEKFP